MASKTNDRLKVCRIDQNNADADHCWRCHYSTCQNEINQVIKLAKENPEFSGLKSLYGNGWGRTADLIWACFCMQWPLIGWAMIMGKE